MVLSDCEPENFNQLPHSFAGCLKLGFKIRISSQTLAPEGCLGRGKGKRQSVEKQDICIPKLTPLDLTQAWVNTLS